ncbi:MAG TPA: hypothetical protein VFQ22_01935 [Longimicrobiales bacterium]|nr:hypothetical protein [Longimicrobiales bacterium]
MRRAPNPLLAVAALPLVAAPLAATAQTCSMSEGYRLIVPVDPPERGWGALPVLGPTGAPLGVGHLHAVRGDAASGPPGSDDWLARVELPLSREPGADPFAWIARRWIVRPGLPPEPLVAMIETGYEEPSFAVLERRENGWMRVRYAPGEGDAGTGWVHDCALGTGAQPLAFTPWSAWLTAERSPLFLRSQQAGALLAEPSDGAPVVATIEGEHALYPREVRGEWMRVTLELPSTYCAAGATASRREGWIRWLTPERGPEVWYFTRGC